MKQHFLLGFLVGLVSLASSASAQISPSLQTVDIGTVAVTPIDRSPTSVIDEWLRASEAQRLADCQDRDFYLQNRHNDEIRNQCTDSLARAADAQSADFLELELAYCPGETDICQEPPRLHRFKHEQAAPPTSFGFDGLLSGDREHSRAGLVGGMWEDIADALTKKEWDENCGVFSCEEYAYEKYHELEALDLRALELKDDPGTLASEILGPDGWVERRSSGDAELTFLRKNGQAAASVTLDETRLSLLENPFRRFARLFLHKDEEKAGAGEGYAWGLHNCGPDAEDPYDAGWHAVHAFDPELASALLEAYLQGPDDGLSGLSGFARQQALFEGTSQFAPQALELAAALKREFLPLALELERVDTQLSRQSCRWMRPSLREHVAALVSSAEPYLAFAQAAGCLQGGFSLCDWAPGDLVESILQEDTGIFAALSRRETDYQSCLNVTGGQFGSVANSLWLSSERTRLRGTGCSTGFCECAAPVASQCEVPASLNQDTSAVDAFVEAVPRWLTSLDLPRDPATGRFAVRQAVGEVGREGNGSFNAELSYQFGWELENPGASDLCDASLALNASVLADASAFGRSTLPSRCVPLSSHLGDASCVEAGSRHLAQATLEAQVSPEASEAHAALYVLGSEIFGAEDSRSSGQVYLTGDERRTETFFRGSERVVVAAIPLRLEAGIAGSVGLESDLELEANCLGPDRLQLENGGRFEPYARVDAFASVSLDYWVAEAGVRTDLNVFELSFPFELQINTQSEDSDLRLDAGAELDLLLTVLRGNISAFVEVETLLDGTKRYSKELYGWPGLVSSAPLFGTQLSFPLNRVRDALAGGDDSAPELGMEPSFTRWCPDVIDSAPELDLPTGVAGCVPVALKGGLAAITGGFKNDTCSEPAGVIGAEGARGGSFFVDLSAAVDVTVSRPGSATTTLLQDPVFPSLSGAQELTWATPSSLEPGKCVPLYVGLLDGEGAATTSEEGTLVQLRVQGGRIFYDASCAKEADAIQIESDESGTTIYASADGSEEFSLAADAPGLLTESITVPTQGAFESSCGDATLDKGEECDDGATTSGDGCSEFCLVEIGFVCTGEQKAQCSSLDVAQCGDGVVEGDELCDFGSKNGIPCQPKEGASCSYCDEACALKSEEDSVIFTQQRFLGIDGELPNADVFTRDMTPDGRYLLVSSAASNLVEGDTNGAEDLFRWDRTDNTILRVNVGNGGEEATLGTRQGSISADGNRIVFESRSANLVPADSNGRSDVFLRDVTAQTTTRLNLGPGATQDTRGGYDPHISANGYRVAFYSGADLTGVSVDSTDQIYVVDLEAGTMQLASVNNQGAPADDYCESQPALSQDGRYVAFSSYARNLDDTTTEGEPNLFVRDLATQSTWRIDDPSGAQLRGAQTRVKINALGQIAFTVSGVVYVHDVTTKATTAPSFDMSSTYLRSGEIADDGRHLAITASVQSGGGESSLFGQIFVVDLQNSTSKMVTTNSEGTAGDGSSTLVRISSTGSAIAYHTEAGNLSSPEVSPGDYSAYVAEY